jgi:hypothetical protein
MHILRIGRIDQSRQIMAAAAVIGAMAAPIALTSRTEATAPTVSIFYPGLGPRPMNRLRQAGKSSVAAVLTRNSKCNVGLPCCRALIRARSAIPIGATKPLQRVAAAVPAASRLET